MDLTAIAACLACTGHRSGSHRPVRSSSEMFFNPAQEVEVHLTALSGNRPLKLTLSRAVFEDLCKDLFDKCMDQVDELLSDPNMPPKDWPPPMRVRA